MTKALETSLLRVRGLEMTPADDWLAVERPLEIRARTIGGAVRVVSTTMRTPGEDRALTTGFLFSERVIHRLGQIRSLATIDDDTVMVELSPDSEAALERTQRSFVTSGACGVCGRTSLDAIFDVPATIPSLDRHHGAPITTAVICALPAALRAAQATFAQTGGLHAAGLFSRNGTRRTVHEDVGRHNAVDKLVGAAILEERPFDEDSVLVVSGRASFELVQKAAVAGISVMGAVGAPSSLAVEMARRAGLTLLGFVRDGGFNVYSGAERILRPENAMSVSLP